MKHGTHRVEYQPFEIGTYKVEVLYHGNTISSKPFLVEICDPSRVKVVDVEDGIIGRDQIFKGILFLLIHRYQIESLYVYLHIWHINLQFLTELGIDRIFWYILSHKYSM